MLYFAGCWPVALTAVAPSVLAGQAVYGVVSSAEGGGVVSGAMETGVLLLWTRRR